MNLTGSQLKNWLMCPAYSLYHDVLRRGLDKPSAALELGTYFHHFMECKLKAAAPVPPVLDEKAMKEWLKLQPFAETWTCPPTWEVLHVEKALEMPMGNHILMGKLDALVKWNGSFWSLQWKTTGSKNMEAHSELIRIGWHECFYQRLAESAGYVPFAGTILVTARVLSQKALDEGVARSEQFSPILPPQYLARTKAMVDERIFQACEVANAMHGYCDPSRELDPKMVARLRERHVLKNTDHCYGMFKNSKCPYFDVCHEGASIDSAPFVDLPDRYAAEATEGVVDE